MRHTFKREERLGGFYLRSLLFEKGKTLFCYPFRVVYLVVPEEKLAESFPLGQNKSFLSPSAFPARLLLAVPKKVIRKAAHRNPVKRRIREAYRQNKKPFYSFIEEQGMVCLIGMVYVAKDRLTYQIIETGVVKALEKVCQSIQTDLATHESDRFS